MRRVTLLDSRITAARLGVGLSTLQRYARQGWLPFVRAKVRGRWQMLFRWAEVYRAMRRVRARCGTCRRFDTRRCRRGDVVYFLCNRCQA